MSSGVQRAIRRGVTLIGANLDVDTVGFTPGEVEVQNTATGVRLFWQEGMPDASAIATAANGDRTYITSNGITPRPNGFRVGSAAGTGAAVYRAEE
jgi:hypothetical protein